MALTDINYANGEITPILEIPLGLMNAPLDILWNPYILDVVLELPNLGIYSPLDILQLYSNYDMPVEEIIIGITPVYVVNEPLDITMGLDNDDLLTSELILNISGGEKSYAYIV